MALELVSASDPASTLSTLVRTIAVEADRLLKRPDPDPLGLRALRRRIADLRGQVTGGRQMKLARWLENLQRRVEARHREAGPDGVAADVVSDSGAAIAAPRPDPRLAARVRQRFHDRC